MSTRLSAAMSAATPHRWASLRLTHPTVRKSFRVGWVERSDTHHCAYLIDLRAGGLDNFRPLRALVLDELCELLGRGSIELEAHAAHARFELGIFERFDERGIQAIDDFRGRAGRRD